MRSHSQAELQKIATEQQSAMDDQCNIYSISLSSGTYGTKITETRSYRASGTICGINYAEGEVVTANGTEFVKYDVTLRLVASQVLASTDEVELYEKGNYRVSGTFVLSSPPTVNSSVQYAKLKRQVP